MLIWWHKNAVRFSNKKMEIFLWCYFNTSFIEESECGYLPQEKWLKPCLHCYTQNSSATNWLASFNPKQMVTAFLPCNKRKKRFIFKCKLNSKNTFGHFGTEKPDLPANLRVYVTLLGFQLLLVEFHTLKTIEIVKLLQVFP